jgi:hypothetical protein
MKFDSATYEWLVDLIPETGRYILRSMIQAKKAA